jgi:hypothetical protein
VLSVSPNPTSGVLNVKVKGYDNERVSVAIINAFMSKILEKEFTVTHQDFNTEFDISQYPSGIYFLHFTYGSHTLIKKVIKL